MPEDYALLDFINDVTELITKQTPAPSEEQVIMLAQKIGISVPGGHLVDFQIHQIGQQALRDSALRSRFLEKITKVFPTLPKARKSQRRLSWE